MAILLGCGDGLHAFDGSLSRVECPLKSITVLSGGGFAAVDGCTRQLWDGRCIRDVEPGVESALWWRGHMLTLSSETDSITLRDGPTGQPITLAPAGVYPQQMCFAAQADTVAVCGGADGCIRLLALPSLACAESFAAANDATLTVTGSASVTLTADYVRVSVGVSTTAATVEEASTLNNASIHAVIAALKEAGVAEEDIATSNYSVHAEYDYASGSQQLAGYNVTNQLSVIIRDMEHIGATLDKATAMSPNNIYFYTFICN